LLPSPPSQPEIRHATTIAVAGRGLMVEGPSGSGKSTLAVQMLAMGARLVADDRTRLRPGRGSVGVWAEAPEPLPALVEVRGLGLLPAVRTGPVPLYAVLRLDAPVEAERLPAPRECEILGRRVALFHPRGNGPLAAPLMLAMAAMTSPAP